MIPPKEYAEMVGAKYQTVMLWLRQDLIPGAQRFDLPAGGHYYVVPENAPKPETRRGPKPKSDDQEAANGKVETPAGEAKPKRGASKSPPAKKALKKSAKRAKGN